jgi:hypothetical protein
MLNAIDNQNSSAQAGNEKSATLLTPNEVKTILGLRTRTSHTLRQLEIRGVLRPLRLTRKTLRYRREDVARIIGGAL